MLSLLPVGLSIAAFAVDSMIEAMLEFCCVVAAVRFELLLLFALDPLLEQPIARPAIDIMRAIKNA